MCKRVVNISQLEIRSMIGWLARSTNQRHVFQLTLCFKTLAHDPAQKIHNRKCISSCVLNLLFFFWEMTTDRSDNKPSTLLETCNGHITCKNAHRSHVALFICITCVPINKIQGGSKKKRVFSNVFWPHEFCYNKTLFVHI